MSADAPAPFDATWIVVAVLAAIVVAFVVLRRGSAAAAPPVPDGLTLDRTVELLLERGETIEAVRRVRESLGIGLKDAKALVDRVRAGESATLVLRPSDRAPAATSGDDLDDRVRALLQRGEKIEAIRLVREHTGLGLKDAKDYVERL